MIDDIYQDDDVEDPRDGDEEIIEPVRYAISSYGADLTFDGIVSRMDRDDIFIPEFQRKLVWTSVQASRFIESLLLGLPVPGVFLFKEPDTKRLMVVDGQQRLRTVHGFYHELFNDRPFKLQGVSKDFAGMTYGQLDDHDRREIDTAIIHATIFQQDEPGDDRSSVYSVFERLNSGGTALSPQEIRACIYRGKLNDLLEELAGDKHWRNLYGSISRRKKDEEVILRFLALHHSSDRYTPPMKSFLNKFMEEYQNPDEVQTDRFRDVFLRTVKATDMILTPTALRPKHTLNISIVDAVLVGLARRLERGAVKNHGALQSEHERLLLRLQKEELYTRSTTDRDRVMKRIDYACSSFEPVA